MTKAWEAIGRLVPTWADRLLDWGIAVFAAWTVSYHGSLLFGASRTVAAAGMVVLAGVLIGLLSRRPADAPPARVDPADDDGPRPAPRAALVFAGAAGVLVALRSPLFWPVTLLLAIVLATRLPAWAATDRRYGRPGPAIVVLLIAVGSGALSAAAVVWTYDDAYYVNRALVVAESTGPIPFGVDTMHSDGRFPSAEPDNDLGSWHPLAGLGADLLGMSPRGFISLIAQPLVAMAAVLAIWRALGVLGASRPGWATAIVIVVALALAGGGRSVWANMWISTSGRGTVATLLVPMALILGVRAGRDPGWRSGLAVALVCVAGAGSTVTAAFVLPVALVGGIVAAADHWWAPGMRVVWAWAGGGLAYLGVIGLIGVLTTSGLAVSGVGITSVAMQWAWGAVGGEAAPVVVGSVTAICLTALVLSPAGARRASVLLVVIGLAFVVSPLALVYAGKGAPTVFRGGWAVAPMVLFGLGADALARRVPGRVALGALVASMLAFGNPVTSLNLTVPTSDLPARQERTEAALRLAALASDGAAVAGPWNVIGLLPALTTRAHPVGAQDRFVLSIGAQDPGFLAADRIAVVEMTTTGEYAGSPEQLRGVLDDLGVEAICLSDNADDSGSLRSALRDAGFSRSGAHGPCHYWSR